MHQTSDPIGDCSECGASLFAVDVLVEYRTDGGARYYAECPDCGTVVHPE